MQQKSWSQKNAQLNLTLNWLVSVILPLSHFLFGGGGSVLHREESKHALCPQSSHSRKPLRAKAHESKRVFRKPEFNSIPLHAWPALSVKNGGRGACVWPHSLPGGGGRDSPLFLSKSSAAWVFSLSSWSSQTTGSHLTRFIFIDKRREAGARCHRRPLTAAATNMCFASSAAVPRARAFLWLLLYALPFCSKLITHSIKKEKTTQLEGCLTHAHSHIPKCVRTHAHKLRVYTTPYHTHMHTIYKHNPPRKYYTYHIPICPTLHHAHYTHTSTPYT